MHSGSWADYDNDGDLDLIVAGYSRGPVLYANKGNGRFTKAPAGGPYARDQRSLRSLGR